MSDPELLLLFVAALAAAGAFALWRPHPGLLSTTGTAIALAAASALLAVALALPAKPNRNLLVVVVGVAGLSSLYALSLYEFVRELGWGGLPRHVFVAAGAFLMLLSVVLARVVEWLESTL